MQRPDVLILQWLKKLWNIRPVHDTLRGDRYRQGLGDGGCDAATDLDLPEINAIANRGFLHGRIGKLKLHAAGSLVKLKHFERNP